MVKDEQLKQVIDKIKNLYGIIVTYEQAREALLGNGDELKKVKKNIDSDNSSALQALLVFSQVSENNAIEIDGIKYTEVHFEYNNEVINEPSSMDVILLDGEQGKERNCLLVESKCKEYFKKGENITQYKVGPSYLSNHPNGYFKKLNLSSEELVNIGIDLSESFLNGLRDKSSHEVKEKMKQYNKEHGYEKEGGNIAIKPILNHTYVYSYGIKQVLSHTIGIMNLHNPNGKCSDYLKDEKFKTVKFLTIDNGYINNSLVANKNITDDIHSHEKYVLNILKNKGYMCGDVPITFLNHMTYQELWDKNKTYFENMPKVVEKYKLDWVKLGPFFYINNQLLFNAKIADQCELRTDKLDNPYSHEKLFERKYGDRLDYIDYPRGRVVWDITNKRAVIYIDPCINNNKVIGEIVKAFNLKDYVVEGDIHYHCKKCSDEIWNS